MWDEWACGLMDLEYIPGDHKFTIIQEKDISIFGHALSIRVQFSTSKSFYILKIKSNKENKVK